MTNYIRVIPRDLFNESKLLKCLGMLYIASERAGWLLTVEKDDEGSYDGFTILQDEDSGAISCESVVVRLRGELVHCFTPLNSRRPHPLYATWRDNEAEVFTESGELSAEFLALVPSA